jgi:hypothetical protein
MNLARSFGNDSCPAVMYTEVMTGQNREHHICYGPYKTGELGEKIKHILGACCNASVEVVSDGSAHGPPTTDCWYACNATVFDETAPDYGDHFWQLEQCVLASGDDYGNGSYGMPNDNPYNLRCYPRLEGRSGGNRAMPGGASRLGFGLLAVLAFTVLSI